MKISFLLLCLCIQVFAKPKCGYEACTKSDPNALNVHIVAHSHDDVGWLKTVDQYYYGNRLNIQRAGVKYIIDSVVNALQENPERKFIQVESAFLYKWWSEQPSVKKEQFINLLNNGQLEIVGGAWSMNDEAAAHYHSIIDQFTFGLGFLQNTYGNCSRPKIGWQIDPFGHTREMASIFAQMGFDAVFFARLDWRDKSERMTSQTAEMLWKGSANLGNSSLLFTHALYNHYSPPPGFYFDILSNDDPLVPNKNSTEYNLDDKLEEFTRFVKKQSAAYITNNIIITMGNDFTYQDALYSFKNLDILIEAYRRNIQRDNYGRRINLFYSTPACYIKAVNENATASDIQFKVKTDDFIPYASDYHSYWSGYYTSRPTQKRFERQANNLLQIAKQLSTSRNDTTLKGDLNELKSAVGIMQHHDAITGTEKQHVAEDYAKIVMDAINHTHVNINKVLPKLLSKIDQPVNLNLRSCLLANVSYCEETQAKRFVVSIYNPLSRNASFYVRLPVNADSFQITGPRGEDVEWQIVPTIANFSYVYNIKPSKYDLVFRAVNIAPLGIQVYYVETGSAETDKQIKPDTSKWQYVLGHGKGHKVQINPNTGFIHSISLDSGLSIKINQSLMYYVGAQGNNMVFENRSSGAYIFRPSPDEPIAQHFATNLSGKTVTYRGKLVDEYHQTFNDWVKQIVRVYKDENHIEFDWLVGPIDIDDFKSKEIISRFETNVDTEHFYTDSNGREILIRRNNHRETYNFTREEPIAGNYYPVTSGISIKDELKAVEVAVLTDRAQGGASLNLGQMELMVHRCLLKDDAFGVGEALSETEYGQGLVVRGQHFLTFGGSNNNSVHGSTRHKQREIAQRKLLSPWVFVADASSKEHSLENLRKLINFEYKGLTRSLPSDVQILTLEPWNNKQVLLRLENILEKSEDGKNVTVTLSGLFSQFKIVKLEEYTLAANQRLSENERLKWKSGGCLSGSKCDIDDAQDNHVREHDPKALEYFEVTLGPMEIRTFLATVEY